MFFMFLNMVDKGSMANGSIFQRALSSLGPVFPMFFNLVDSGTMTNSPVFLMFLNMLDSGTMKNVPVFPGPYVPCVH